MRAGPRIALNLAVTGLVIGLACYVRATSEAKAPASAPDADARAGLRAFYTAPPMIPHTMQTQDNQQCTYCHEKVRRIGDRVTVPTPHIQFSNCTQCHVGTTELNAELPTPEVLSAWIGLEEPKDGTRAHEYAPPVIPHRTFLRENCNSCHGSDHPNEALRGPHPERSNCMQCHVAKDANQF